MNLLQKIRTRFSSRKCYMNDELVILPKDLLSMFPHCLNGKRNFKPVYYVETAHLKRMYDFIKPDSIVLEIGASGGHLTACIAKKFPDIIIYAFEPARRAFKLLNQTIYLNELNNVVPKNLAIYNINQTIPFAEYKMIDALSWNPERSAINNTDIDRRTADVYPIQSSTIDSLSFARNLPISLIKIDIEGFEIEALQGAHKIIDSYKPAFSIDIHQVPGDSTKTTEEAVRNILEPYKYNFENLDHVLIAYQY